MEREVGRKEDEGGEGRVGEKRGGRAGQGSSLVFGLIRQLLWREHDRSLHVVSMAFLLVPRRTVPYLYASGLRVIYRVLWQFQQLGHTYAGEHLQRVMHVP